MATHPVVEDPNRLNQRVEYVEAFTTENPSAGAWAVTFDSGVVKLNTLKLGSALTASVAARTHKCSAWSWVVFGWVSGRRGDCVRNSPPPRGPAP